MDKRNQMDSKYDPKSIFLEGYTYSVQSEKGVESTDLKESTDKEES